MSRPPIVLDLDNPDIDDLERVWAELHRRHLARAANPELHDLLIRRLDELELEPAIAEEIRRQLTYLHPSAVLAGHLDVFIPKDMPALGAVLQGRDDQRAKR